MKYSPTWLISLALLVTPLLTWTAINRPVLWQDRLVLPELTNTPLPGTPLHQTGTVLPDEVTDTRYLTSADNPVLLNNHVTVKPSGRLIISGGTAIYARRFSSLRILGQLEVAGTAEEPVLFTSNEMNSEDQVWSGIIVSGSGRANFKYAGLHFASPGLTCLPGGKTVFSHGVIKAISLGIYSETNDCLITDSRLFSTRDGVISRNAQPILTNTTIIAPKVELKTVNSK